MKATHYIKSKQIQWAINNDVPLIGSKGLNGNPAYTQDLKQNLFEPLSAENRKRFKQGMGVNSVEI